MSVRVIAWVFDNSETEGSDRLVLLALADRADETGYCWPSIPVIARKARVSERTAQRSLQTLEESGGLKVDRSEGGRGRRSTNRYQISMDLGCQSVTLSLGCQSVTGDTGVTARGDIAVSPDPSVDTSRESSPPTPPQADPNPEPVPDAATNRLTPVPATARAVVDRAESLNLTGSLQVFIERECRRLGIRKARIKPGALRMLEKEDAGEDYRRALVYSLERFGTAGDLRDTLGNWAFQFKEAWRLEAGGRDAPERKSIPDQLEACHRERERRDPRQAWRGNGTSAYRQAQLDESERMLRSMCAKAGVDPDAPEAAE